MHFFLTRNVWPKDNLKRDILWNRFFFFHFLFRMQSLISWSMWKCSRGELFNWWNENWKYFVNATFLFDFVIIEIANSFVMIHSGFGWFLKCEYTCRLKIRIDFCCRRHISVQETTYFPNVALTFLWKRKIDTKKDSIVEFICLFVMTFPSPRKDFLIKNSSTQINYNFQLSSLIACIFLSFFYRI